MSKGRNAKVGDKNVSANGYTYIKTSTGWRLYHHVLAEERDGKQYPSKEFRISFKDNNRENFDLDNIIVAPRGKVRGHQRSHHLQRIEDLMFHYVENAEDKSDALQELKDVLSDVRLSHNFGRLP